MLKSQLANFIEVPIHLLSINNQLIIIKILSGQVSTPKDAPLDHLTTFEPFKIANKIATSHPVIKESSAITLPDKDLLPVLIKPTNTNNLCSSTNNHKNA